MNSDEQWLLYLWSGAFASAVGGVVAMLVLWRTNAHQSKLARQQLADQKSEAKRSRCAAAVGDLVAAIEQLPAASETSVNEVETRIFAATSALTRLALEDMDEGTVTQTRASLRAIASLSLGIADPPFGHSYDERIRALVDGRRALLREISEGFVLIAPVLLREAMGESVPEDVEILRVTTDKMNASEVD